MYQDNIALDEPCNIHNLFNTRLQLQWQFESWRDKLGLECSLLTTDELDRNQSINGNSLRFRLNLSIHYYRVVLLMNGPVLIALMKETRYGSQDRSAEVLLEQAVPIIRQHFGTLRDLHSVMKAVLSYDSTFLDQNNAWWLCNYTGQQSLTCCQNH